MAACVALENGLGRKLYYFVSFRPAILFPNIFENYIDRFTIRFISRNNWTSLIYVKWTSHELNELKII